MSCNQSENSDTTAEHTEPPHRKYRVRIEPMPEHLEERYGVDPLTGGVYVKAAPGEKSVSSEEIYKMLEDFP